MIAFLAAAGVDMATVPGLIMNIAAVVVLALLGSILIITVGPDHIDGYNRYDNDDIS